MRSSAIVLGNAQLDGGVATLEVRAHGRHEDTELVLVGRLHADDVARGDHERADVERRAGTERGHPRGVGLNDLLDRLDEAVLREGGHDQALGGIGHALGVHVGTEAHDGPIGGGIGLEPLEDLLAIMEDARALRQRDAVIGSQGALIPCAILVVGHIAIVGLAIAEIEVSPVQVLLLNGHGELLTRCGRPRRRCPLNIKAVRRKALAYYKNAGHMARHWHVRLIVLRRDGVATELIGRKRFARRCAPAQRRRYSPSASRGASVRHAPAGCGT